MGGLPLTNGQRLGHFNLNLGANELDRVARWLQIQDENDKHDLGPRPGRQQPQDGEEIMVTHRGRYVRITYRGGRAETITPLFV